MEKNRVNSRKSGIPRRIFANRHLSNFDLVSDPNTMATTTEEQVVLKEKPKNLQSTVVKSTREEKRQRLPNLNVRRRISRSVNIPLIEPTPANKSFVKQAKNVVNNVDVISSDTLGAIIAVPNVIAIPTTVVPKKAAITVTKKAVKFHGKESDVAASVKTKANVDEPDNIVGSGEAPVVAESDLQIKSGIISNASRKKSHMVLRRNVKTNGRQVLHKTELLSYF